jgi:hypothetical protein
MNATARIIHLDTYRAKSKAPTLNPHNHPHQRTITSNQQIIDQMELIQIQAIVFSRALKKIPDDTGFSLHIAEHYEDLENRMTTVLNALRELQA